MRIGVGKKTSYINFFISSFFIIILTGEFTILSSQWIVEKIVDNNLRKGNYDISGSSFVWESFDGNDWEIFYSRNNDVICGRRFNLIMHCGNGNKHKEGGITKVGGKKRINRVKYDYEGLIHFDLRYFSGEIKKAKMRICFEPLSSSKFSCKSKTYCQSCKKCQYKSKKQYGLFHRYNYGNYYYSSCGYKNIYRSFLNTRANRYLRSHNRKRSYLNYGACFNPRLFYRSVLNRKWKSSCNPKPVCNHKCGCKPPNIVIYNQNKGPWDMKTVTYNTFKHCPWDDKIGEVSISDISVKEVTFQNEDFRDLVQAWVDDPYSNNGIVLTADFGKKYKLYYKVKSVSLQLYFKDRIMQITDNDLDDVDPRIDGRYFTWTGDDGNDAEIFYWNGYKIIQITHNDYDDFNSRISGQDLVWEGFNGTNSDIYYRHNNTITNISQNGFDHFEPKIKNGRVTWYGGSEDGDDDEIFYYNGNETIQITENDYDDWFPPEIHNTMITWQGSDGNDMEIYYWDETDPVIRALSDNSQEDAFPQISDSGIVWKYFDSNDWEIKYWNGTDVIQLTDNESLNDDRQKIDKGSIVWRGFDGSDFDIYYYKDGITERIIDNTNTDDLPLISNDNIIWKSFEYDSLTGTTGWELYYARKKHTESCQKKCTKSCDKKCTKKCKEKYIKSCDKKCTKKCKEKYIKSCDKKCTKSCKEKCIKSCEKKYAKTCKKNTKTCKKKCTKSCKKKNK